ncbi:MAG: phosphoadenosine phosphosulfate reductase family protein [Clostridia bacterium]|nr:phosphoadenosine phosphosulfate reductase family protein [Clostridia bacterium]
MYCYEWDSTTGGILLNTTHQVFSKEPRPVYYKELDILGFDKYWNYDKNDTYPYMWAEANNYFYRGEQVAKIKGGSIYTAPEIEIIKDPEPDGSPLRFVDIPAMVKKNKDIMESLEQETIKKIYNTYIEHKNRVDVFYVAFSGGKDSVVALDLVQRALPHNEFKVMFGNTDMEFPTTIKLAEEIKDFCFDEEIDFIEASADMTAIESWKLFGPPARKLRWCCSVHKTVPVINKLCEVLGLNSIRSMMITGVRGDESSSRSNYDELSLGKKLAGQFSYHPILNWSSLEVFLYMYERNLSFNDAYKMGFNRVGCIMCPNSSEKHEYMKRVCFPEIVDKFSNLITENSSKDLSGDNKKLFLEVGGWKTRLSGRELKFTEEERFTYSTTSKYHIFKAKDLNDNWKIWYKTIGSLLEESSDKFEFEFKGVYRKGFIIRDGNYSIISIDNEGRNKNSIEFIYFMKNILVKTLYCINCKTCVAECPKRNISMDNGKVEISDNCSKCHECLKIQSGCLYYHSIRGSNEMKTLKGINKYLSVGVEYNWIEEYLSNDNFEPGNRKTDVMFGFMQDAGIVNKRQTTPFGDKIRDIGVDTTEAWALMLCNLAYTPAFGWYVKNVPFYENYDEDRLKLDMGDGATDKAKGEFWNSFKTILYTNEPLRKIGFGDPDVDEKETKTGIKRSMRSIMRTGWMYSDSRVILYSLYKFAEACKDYYQFSLSRLLDHEIDSDGISPTQIFGIGREDMERMLNGLSIKYPEFISAKFTLGLDNITLNSEKTSADVLELF